MKKIITIITIIITSNGYTEFIYDSSQQLFNYNVPCQSKIRYRLWKSDNLSSWIYQKTITSSVGQTQLTLPIQLSTNTFEFFNIDPTPDAPQREWFYSYNGIRSNKESHGHFILVCEDGGFLQIGESGSPYDSGRTLIIKTNSSGQFLWRQESDLYINGRFNLGNSAIEVDDGYVIFGAQSNGGSSTQNSMIVKLDKQNGSVIFLNNINNGGSDAFEHGVESENGFIAVGYKNAVDPSNTFYTEGEGHITFLNSLGQKISDLNINNYLSQGYRIFPISDGYIISGQTSEALQFGLIKLSESGNILWTHEYGYTSNNDASDFDHCFGLAIGADESIFLTGHTQYAYQSSGTSQSNNWDTLTIKIDSDGNELWKRRKGNPRGFDPKYIHDEAWGVCATPDGGCLIVAGSGDEYINYSEQNENGDSNQWVVYLIKYASDGVQEWEKTFQAENNEGYDWAGEDIMITSDGGAIIAVDNGQFGFLKIAPFFNP